MDAGFDLMSLLPMILAMLGAGVFAGLIAGLLGVGGGIVIVPVLFYIFNSLNFDPNVIMHVAIGTSLATIVPTSISSARSHFKRDGIDIPLLKNWAIWIVIGVALGSSIAAFVDGIVLTIVFATIALLAAVNLAVKNDGWTIADELKPGLPRAGSGIFIGAGSAMAGIGGGTFTVPLLSACSYPIRRAVGTASGVGLLIAIPGAIGFIITGWNVDNLPPLSIGYVNLISFGLIIPMTTLFAPVGAKLAHSINTGLLRKIFAIFLIVTAIRMYLSLFI